MDKKSNLKIAYMDVKELIPYANNSRTHNDEQVTQIASSIKEFGFTNPVLIDDEKGIIAGHGRLMAAKKLGLEKVPTITLAGLTEAQKKAYVIADNKLALNAGWDEEMLRIELEALQEENFNLDVIGFTDEELQSLLELDPLDEEEQEESVYTNKISTPIYEVKGNGKPLSECFQTAKYEELLKEIDEAKIPEDVRKFLKLAATRHITFNYENIAEYFAQASDEVKMLFEKSALVIIDYDKAIEYGYINLTKELMKIVGEDYAEQ